MTNLQTLVAKIANRNDGRLLLESLRGLYDQVRCTIFNHAGLVITATAGTLTAKTGAAVTYGAVKGQLFSIAAGVDMPNPAGVVADGTSNVFCFFANTAGALITAANMSVLMGTAGATIDLIRFPKIPEGRTLIGFIIVTVAGGATFTGGTTALGAANITTVYCSPDGNFDPSATF
jgi:hypothetical protein